MLASYNRHIETKWGPMAVYLPSDDLLADYACGVASPGVSLIVAAHLTQAPESRRRLADFERIGGVLLREQEPEAVTDSSWDRVMARIDQTPPSEAVNIEATMQACTQQQAPSPLPKPVLDHIGMGFDEIPWKFLLPGVASYDATTEQDEQIMLLRARPGARVPKHTHKGVEMTLVMQGALADDGVVYRKGDLAVNDEHDDHCPKAVGDETCFCLIVQQGDLRFTGSFSRLLNFLGE